VAVCGVDDVALVGAGTRVATGGAVAAADTMTVRLQLKHRTAVPLGIAWLKLSVAWQCGQVIWMLAMTTPPERPRDAAAF